MAEAKNLSTNKVAQPSITSMPNQTNSELNHWLSLGTRNTAENPLARSSSAALEETITPLQTAACDPSQLARSSSVPMEPGQWMLRHKEMRALRRLEAKKRVAERRAEEAAGSSLLEVTGASSTAIYKFKAEGYLSVSTAPNGAQNAKGITNSFDAVLVERDIIKPVLTSSKRVKASNDMTEDNDGEEVAKAKMPRVRTIGAGGRMIEGVLHRYHQGHVSIRCVCHGSFYSPTEFVKHAGGNEVANPLRHITVVCSPPSDYSNSGGSVAPLHW